LLETPVVTVTAEEEDLGEGATSETDPSRSSLLEQIRSGGQRNLRKVEPVVHERRVSARGGLLEEIRARKGGGLRKVEVQEKKPAAAAAAAPGLGNIMEILARRAAIEGSDDEEEEEEDADAWED
jgi:hypothetical protein